MSLSPKSKLLPAAFYTPIAKTSVPFCIRKRKNERAGNMVWRRGKRRANSSSCLP
jgi:hypothetical protein